MIQPVAPERIPPGPAKPGSLGRVPLSYRVAAAGVMLIGVLLFNMLIALQSAQNVFDDQDAVQRGIVSRQRVELMMSSAKDIAGGVRGFFITGDTQFRDSYEHGRQALQAQLALADPESGSDPHAAALLADFRRDATALLEQSQIFVAQRQQMPGNASVETLTSLVRRQKTLMDALRGSAAALIASRAQTNTALDAASARARSSARISILVPSFISVLLAAFLSYLVFRDLRQRQALELQSKRLLQQERLARVQAEAASHAKDEFVSTISHELRTPLQAILGWAQFLTRLTRGRDAVPTRQIGAELQTIERNAQSLARMIDDLLDVSRIITGKLTLVTRRIDLSDILQTAIEVAQPAAAGKGLQLTLELHDAPLWLVGDADRLRQVVINLVNNAIKFTPGGGSIRLSARRAGSGLEMRIRDSGIGIASELLPRVFERYVQGSASSVRQHGGLGLGLAIVKHLVEMHGGQVAVSSAGSGQGAEFVVHLPIRLLQSASAESAPETQSAPRPEAGADRAGGPRLSGLRLLAVDDDPDVRLVLQSLLLEEGASVVLASSAAEAMQQLRAQRMDLILSDVGMPETDGYELARSIRALVAADSATPAAVPLIALTAFSRAEDAQRALANGFDLHLAKPVDMEKLMEVLIAHTASAAKLPTGPGSPG